MDNRRRNCDLLEGTDNERFTNLRFLLQNKGI